MWKGTQNTCGSFAIESLFLEFYWMYSGQFHNKKYQIHIWKNKRIAGAIDLAMKKMTGQRCVSRRGSDVKYTRLNMTEVSCIYGGSIYIHKLTLPKAQFCVHSIMRVIIKNVYARWSLAGRFLFTGSCNHIQGHYTRTYI